MIKKILLSAFVLSLCFGISNQSVQAFKKEGFVTFNIAVSKPDIDKKLSEIDLVLNEATKSSTPVTFFVDYDQIKVATVASYFADVIKSYPYHRVGLRVAVSRELLEDTAGFTSERRMKGPASVSLASYSLSDRTALLEQMMKTYFAAFGSYPSVVLEDYVDSRTLVTMSEKYGVVGAMFAKGDLSDFIDFEPEDSKIISSNQAPYYPRRTNSLEPATNEKEKVDIVVLPFDVFTGSESDFLKAENLMDKSFNEFGIYNPSMTTGFGSRIVVFKEYLNWIKSNKEKYTLRPITANEFSLWYLSRYPYFTATFTWKDGDDWNFFSKDYWISINRDRGIINSLLWWRNGVSERWWMEQNQDDRLPLTAPIAVKNQDINSVDFKKMVVEYQRVRYGDENSYIDLLPYEIKTSSEISNEKLPFVRFEKMGRYWLITSSEKNNLGVIFSIVTFTLLILGWYGYQKQSK